MDNCNRDCRMCINECNGKEYVEDIEDIGKKNNEFDVIIIGAGVIGCSVARELCKYQLKIGIIESYSDVSRGSSSANSGIVHGGFDAKHGTLKSKLSLKGNRKFSQLNQELNFGYKEIGSLVLAFNDADVTKLKELYENGIKNGCTTIQLVNSKHIHAIEPNVSLSAKLALYAPNSGICSPYEYTIALAENAIYNGVKLFTSQSVIDVKKRSDNKFVVKTCNKTNNEFVTKRVINCSGLYADDISRISNAEDFKISPRKGEYIMLNRYEGKKVKHVLFQAPTARWGKGILVTPTIAGNLMIGPSAKDINDKTDKSTSIEELAYVSWSAKRTLPTLDLSSAFRSFAGLRAKPSNKDFIIEESKKQLGFINVAGIESPGLTSSPAIAEMVRDILLDSFKRDNIIINKNENFYPYRSPITFQKDDLYQGEIDHVNPKLNIICRCERVSESEIVESMKRGIKIQSLDSIKFRTRAGMGVCQGNFCKPRVTKLIQRELGITPSQCVLKNHTCNLHKNQNDIKIDVPKALLSKL